MDVGTYVSDPLKREASDAELLAPLPGWLQAIVIALVPPAVTFLSGRQARHTSRISQM
ncbi:hypothetical protein ACIP69_15125 [Streptomyces hygroscopicus]|uniref:hypothetical protein n=1 Tax=Streptomyces hygroscopicus TaxID=1912 RepID=UPI0038038F89